MTDKFKAFWLGVFIIIAIVLIAWLILFLKPTVGDGKVTLTVRFSNIDKVTEGTRVNYAGRPVGEVVEIREIRDPREAEADAMGNLYIYELTLKVDSSVQVYTYDEIIFATSGLLGEKNIAILPKAPPFGAPPAQNVTHDILYARSTDKLVETLNQLSGVADSFGDTLGEVNTFIESNNTSFTSALSSFSGAAQELKNFMARANEMDVAGKASTASDSLISAMARAEDFFSIVEEKELIERISGSFDAIHAITTKVANGEGTIGRLLHSECTFVQITTILCQLEAILYDIKNYGILYQFDRKWQRSQSHCTEIPCSR